MIEHKKLKQFGMIALGILITWVGTEQFHGLVDWSDMKLLGLGVPAAVTAAVGSLLSLAFFALANWYRTSRLTDGGRLAGGATDSF